MTADRFWLIHFEDVDRGVEVFTDEDAARRRSEDVGTAWTHTLFAQVDLLDEVRVVLLRAAYVAESLHAMIDQETWRASGGDDQQGHYEGDYRAEQLLNEIKGWGT